MTTTRTGGEALCPRPSLTRHRHHLRPPRRAERLLLRRRPRRPRPHARHPHAPRAGRSLHGPRLRPRLRQDRRLRCRPRPRIPQRHRCPLHRLRHQCPSPLPDRPAPQRPHKVVATACSTRSRTNSASCIPSLNGPAASILQQTCPVSSLKRSAPCILIGPDPLAWRCRSTSSPAKQNSKTRPFPLPAADPNWIGAPWKVPPTS